MQWDHFHNFEAISRVLPTTHFHRLIRIAQELHAVSRRGTGQLRTKQTHKHVPATSNGSSPSSISLLAYWPIPISLVLSVAGAAVALPPQPFEPLGVGLRIAYGIVDLFMPHVLLNQPGVVALIRQVGAAGMLEHVGVDREDSPRLLPGVGHNLPGRLPRQRTPPFRDEDEIERGLRPLLQPAAHRPDLVSLHRMGIRD